jgi:hypothetical protein
MGLKSLVCLAPGYVHYDGDLSHNERHGLNHATLGWKEGQLHKPLPW